MVKSKTNILYETIWQGFNFQREKFPQSENWPINQQSNHPSRVIGNIPQSINGRLSEISYGKESFEKAASICRKALDNSGYKHLLAFSLHIFTQIQILEEKIGRGTLFGTTPI